MWKNHGIPKSHQKRAKYTTQALQEFDSIRQKIEKKVWNIHQKYFLFKNKFRNMTAFHLWNKKDLGMKLSLKSLICSNFMKFVVNYCVCVLNKFQRKDSKLVTIKLSKNLAKLAPCTWSLKAVILSLLWYRMLQE